MSKAKGGSRGGILPRVRSLAQKSAQVRGTAVNHRGDLGEAAFAHKAISLGFMVAKPYGHHYRYDFIVEGGSGFRSVQVKACAHIFYGQYQTSIFCRKDRLKVAYTASDVDFVAVHIIPEETWYVLPVREVAAGRMGLSRPKGHPGRDRYAHYREAWHLLREPDGLSFG